MTEFLTRESWERVKAIVKRRGGETCQYCGAYAPDGEPDHILPLAKGGTDSLTNLVWCCPKCNRQKGNKTLREWVQMSCTRPKWQGKHEWEQWRKEVEAIRERIISFGCDCGGDKNVLEVCANFPQTYEEHQRRLEEDPLSMTLCLNRNTENKHEQTCPVLTMDWDCHPAVSKIVDGEPVLARWWVHVGGDLPEEITAWSDEELAVAREQLKTLPK